jgi:hypothetical protein
VLVLMDRVEDAVDRVDALLDGMGTSPPAPTCW